MKPHEAKCVLICVRSYAFGVRPKAIIAGAVLLVAILFAGILFIFLHKPPQDITVHHIKSPSMGQFGKCVLICVRSLPYSLDPMALRYPLFRWLVAGLLRFRSFKLDATWCWKVINKPTVKSKSSPDPFCQVFFESKRQ